MKSQDILVGARFGAWTVIGAWFREKRGEGRGANYITLYPCRCDCGTERDVRAFKLLSNSKSCGCLMRASKVAQARHGQSRAGKRTRLYRVWGNMVQRCHNPKNDGYADYGGRGIKVCSEWRDFSAFAAWAEGMVRAENDQIDRIDNDGDYEPENCRWISDARNKRNTGRNRLLTAFGETKCVADWAGDPRCRVSLSALHYRVRSGLSHEEAIGLPPR